MTAVDACRIYINIYIYIYLYIYIFVFRIRIVEMCKFQIKIITWRYIILRDHVNER